MTLGLVAEIASMTGISPNSARRVARSASHRYKIYFIPKKRGGLRLVAQPAREVKALQRALVLCLSPLLHVHAAATAYQEGSSILGNAQRHARARYILKLDFEDFFSSIREEALTLHIRKFCGNSVTESETEFIINLVLWRAPRTSFRALCIGAPSSPFLSNTVMFDIDETISALCTNLGAVYSRYSDDITVSASEPNVLASVEQLVRAVVVNAQYPTLRFNDNKRVSISRRTSMTVTGLTLANQGFVTVGRNRKRGVRAGVEKFISGRLGMEEVRRLKGEVAFVLSVEPGFRFVLLNTYGTACREVLPRRSDFSEKGK